MNRQQRRISASKTGINNLSQRALFCRDSDSRNHVSAAKLEELTRAASRATEVQVSSSTMDFVQRVYTEYPQMMEAAEYATPPFEDCWLEFPFSHLEIGVRILGNFTPRETRAAVLFSGGVGYPILSAPGRKPTYTGYMLELHSSAALKAGLVTDPLGTWETDPYENAEHSVHKHHSFKREAESLKFYGPPDRTWPTMSMQLLTVATAILIMINSRRPMAGVHLSSGLSPARKITPGMHNAVSVVKIDLTPAEAVTQLRQMVAASEERSPTRLHGVRGTYCHNAVWREQAASCGHVLLATTEDGKSSTCVACRGKRWWRAEHQRGDASAGVVRQQYEVTV